MFVALRLISLILIVIGIMLLGADAVSSLESVSQGGTMVLRSLEHYWDLLGDVEGVKIWCDYFLPAFLAGWIFSMLTVPAWAFTGVTGVVMAFLFGRRTGE